MIDCMKLERLLTEPDISRMSKYIFHWYAKESRIEAQAALAAANMDRKDLLPLVQALIGSEDKMLDKIGGLGCGGFSRIGIDKGTDHAAGIVRAAYDAGVTFFDTAAAYGTQPRLISTVFMLKSGYLSKFLEINIFSTLRLQKG